MNIKILIAAAALLVSSIALAADIDRPGLSDNPRSYLKEFPLGTVSVEDVIEKIGTPDKSVTVADTTYLTYDIQGNNNHGGRIEYTYIVKDGVVTNVKYLNAGNFFGMEQKEDAKQLQGK